MTKIPVGATIAQAYRFAFAKAPAVLKAIWLPLLAQLAVIALGARQVLLLMIGAQARDPSIVALTGHLALLFPFVTIFFFGQLAAGMQTALGQPPRSWHTWPFGKPMWRLLGGFLAAFGAIIAVALASLLAVWLLGLGLNAVLKMAPGLRPATAIIGGLLVAAFFCGLLFIAFRFLFLLAPVNISEQRWGVQRAWELSAGNFWRIFLIVLAITIPVSVINYVYGLLLAGWPPSLPGASQEAKSAAEMLWRIRQITAMIDRWYFTLPLTAILTLFQIGAGCAAQAYAYRVRTLDEAVTN